MLSSLDPVLAEGRESFGSVMTRALGFAGSCVCCGLGEAGALWGCVLAEVMLLCLMSIFGKVGSVFE